MTRPVIADAGTVNELTVTRELCVPPSFVDGTTIIGSGRRGDPLRSGGVIASGFVSIAEDSGMGTGNLSTTGTLDWWAAGEPGGLTNPSARSVSGNRYKKLGGWINKSLSWFNVGTPFSFASGVTFTSNAGDDGGSTSASGVFSNAQVSGVQTNNLAGAGLTFRVPCATSDRVARVFTQFGPTDIRLTARLSDNSVVPVTMDIAQGAKTARFTYRGALGAELIVTVEQLAPGTPGFVTTCFGAVTLGTV